MNPNPVASIVGFDSDGGRVVEIEVVETTETSESPGFNLYRVCVTRIDTGTREEWELRAMSSGAALWAVAEHAGYLNEEEAT